MQIKLNQDLRTPKGKLPKGKIIDVACDGNNNPLDQFWRNRLRDSAIDNCVEIYKQSKVKK